MACCILVQQAITKERAQDALRVLVLSGQLFAVCLIVRGTQMLDTRVWLWESIEIAEHPFASRPSCAHHLWLQEARTGVAPHVNVPLH